MKNRKSVLGLMAVLAMATMGCSPGQLQMNSDPVSRDDSRSTAIMVADWNAPASQQVDASPDGRYMVVAGNENGVAVVDAVTGDFVREFETSYRNVLVNYSPCGELVAACDTEGVMRIWNVRTGKLVSERQM